MQDFLNQLSNDLFYIKHEITGDTIHIYCQIKKESTRKVSSRAVRVLRDIPYGEYKTILHISIEKYEITEAKKKYISQTFTFAKPYARMTNRLNNNLLSMSSEISAIGCERQIRNNYADVSDTTILRIIKKNKQ